MDRECDDTDIRSGHVWSAFDLILEDPENDKENQVFQESLELFSTFQSVWNDFQAIIFGSNYPVLATADPITPIIPGHQQQSQAWGGPVLIHSQFCR